MNSSYTQLLRLRQPWYLLYHFSRGEELSEKFAQRTATSWSFLSFLRVSLLSSPEPRNDRKRIVTEKILKACAKGEIAPNDHRPLISKSRERRRKKREKEKMSHVIAKQKLTVILPHLPRLLPKSSCREGL